MRSPDKLHIQSLHFSVYLKILIILKHGNIKSEFAKCQSTNKVAVNQSNA